MMIGKLYAEYLNMTDFDYTKYRGDDSPDQFSERVGFLVAARHTFPDRSDEEALTAYSRLGMQFHANRLRAADNEVPIILDSSVPIRGIETPCCGGGKVR